MSGDEKNQASVDLAHVRDWVFDLDNTIYPAHCDLFAQIDQRMGDFIARFFGVDFAEAKRIQKGFFHSHGTTLRGLMTEHEMEPADFLDYVHEIDLSPIPQDTRLAEALTRLPGRKFIFTNGTRRHAERITSHMEIDHHFEGIFDIVDSDYLPKPHQTPYETFIGRHGIDPTSAAMFEDIARNLVPAAALGMTTVWVPNPAHWAGDGAEGDHVHHIAEDLGAWLLAALDDGQDF